MMRTAARLHRNNAVAKALRETLKRTPSHPTPQNYPAGRVHTRQTAGVLAKINSNDDDVHRPVPSLLKPTTILTDRSERGGPSHNHTFQTLTPPSAREFAPVTVLASSP